MLPPDVTMKGIASIACLCIAGVLLVPRPPRATALVLSAFLGLIGLNQAAEVARGITAGATQEAWFRFASTAAALDPALFVLFGLLLLQPLAKPWRRAALVAVFATSLVFAALAWLLPLPLLLGGFSFALTTFTAVAYLAILAAAVRRWAASSARSAGLVVVGCSVAAIPVAASWTLLLGEAALSPLKLGYAAVLYPLGIASAALTATGMRAVAGKVPRGLGRSITGALLVGVAFAAALTAFNLAKALHDLRLVSNAADIQFIGRSGAALRWLTFGMLTTSAILRHDLLGMTPRQRRSAARVLLAVVAFVLVELAVLAAITASGASLGAGQELQAVLLGGALVLSQGFGKAIDAAVRLFFGFSGELPREERARVYRVAAVQVVREGRDCGQDARLRDLQAELDLDDETARVLRDLAEHETPAPPLARGQTLRGRYEVGPHIGRGAHGSTFAGRDTLLGRRVALKEIHGVADAREAAIASRVSHPRVVAIHDIVVRRASTVIVSEFMDGGSLEERIASRGALDWAREGDLAVGIADGLAALHAAGIIHRDVKPSNILLTGNGEPKIADFGVAVLAGERTVDLREPIAGTPAYMAPEVQRGAPAGKSTDVFALGVLIRRAYRAPLPAEVEAVIVQAVAEDPAQRWEDGAAMVAALRRAAEAGAISNRPATNGPGR